MLKTNREQLDSNLPYRGHVGKQFELSTHRHTQVSTLSHTIKMLNCECV